MVMLNDYEIENRLGEIIKELVDNGYEIKKSFDHYDLLSISKGDVPHQGSYICGNIQLGKTGDDITLTIDEHAPSINELNKIIKSYLKS